MFEKFVNGKIEYENEQVRGLSEITRESIIKSNLSEFTKNFILDDFQKPDTDSILAKIEKSNKLYFNFTLRPKWTLLTFLFNNFESRPPKEIIKKLDTFPFYKFYADSISDFLNDNIQIFTTKNEISAVIDDTNKAIYDKLNTDITNQKIKNFFLQIFLLKYDAESNYNLESTIPYSFIKIFLRDKNYTNLETKFQKVNNLNEESEISLKDIIKILTDKFSQPEKKDEKIIEFEKPVTTQQAKKEEKIPIKKNIIKEKPEPVIYSEDLLKAAEEKNDIILHEDNVHNISELFDEKTSEKILNKVYDSDLIYKDRSFDKLSHYKTWFEASNHLKEIFQVNRVEIFDKDVTKFVDKLNEYFKRME